MHSHDPDGAQFRKDLILASALFHAPPPKEYITANCARVLRHALIAAGLWDEKLAQGSSAVFHGVPEELEQFPIATLWYASLIELTRQVPKSKRLLNGGGNLVAPAGAHFTACWLTKAGRVVAERLIDEHPEWTAKLTTPET